MKHTAGSRAPVSLNRRHHLITAPRCSRDKATFGKTRPDPLGSRASSGAAVGRPQPTGMSDNGWRICAGDTEPKASRGREGRERGKDDEWIDKCMLVRCVRDPASC